MSSNVLLATCSLSARWLPNPDTDNCHYPLGIGYLHAVLEEAGHGVRTLFLNNVPHEECLGAVMDTIATFHPRVLGLSIISDCRVSSFGVIEHVHAHHPDIHIVLGGVHVTTLADQIARRFPYCTCVLGEGEITLRELVAVMEAGGDRSTVKGIAYWQDGRVIRTAERELIEDLDTLPSPKHAAFFHDNRVMAQIMTSRGCPAACTFCVLDSFSRRKVRFRSPRKVVDEIEAILREFPQVTRMHFLDDQFFSDNARVVAICDEIVRRNLRCGFECAGRMKPIGKAMVMALERAGFTNVYLGLESGSRSVLKKAKKGILPEDAVKAMEMFAGSTVSVSILLIVGLPGESLATITETAHLVQQLQKIKYHTYSHRIQTLFVYPGSEVYEMCKRAGAIDDDLWLTDQDVPYYTVEHGVQELTVLREMLLTYVSPVRLITPGGLALQRHMLPEIIRAAFSRSDMRPIVNTVLHAVGELMKEGVIDFSVTQEWAERMRSVGHVHFSTLTRQVGTEGRFHLSFVQGQAEDLVKDIVHFAYITNYRDLTERVTQRVAEILERHIGQGNDPDNLLMRMGFTEWAGSPQQRIKLRL